MSTEGNEWSKGKLDSHHHLSFDNFAAPSNPPVAATSDDLTEEPRVANENSYEEIRRQSNDSRSLNGTTSIGA